jgi:hypothetical protein
MTVREKVIDEIKNLTDTELKSVADYVDFLKAKSQGNKKNGKKDPLLGLGKKPVSTGIPDASENLDKYIY